jgi:hypothetical protein
VAEQLTDPPRLWSRQEVLTTECVPRTPGLYAWYFRDVPPSVPTEGCVVRYGATLLYAGIAPKAPPQNGKPASGRTLWHRVRYHMRGNACGSTLRLTLGCLLQMPLGLELRRVGSGTRRTFADGEATVSDWMDAHAFVCWMEATEPWLLEAQLIASVSLPLNLDQNRNHAFHATLSPFDAPPSRKQMICQFYERR